MPVLAYAVGRERVTGPLELPAVVANTLAMSIGTILGGFGARIMRIPASEIRPGAELSGTELAVLDQPVTVDNYEGISAVRQPDGKVMLYVVSDDNFWGFQRTLMLMFELTS